MAPGTTSVVAPDPVNGPSPTKRVRRTKAEIDVIKTGLYSILEEQHPATVRGTFYAAVSRGLVPKTEAAYKTTVGRLLTQMRRDGDLDYSWLADNTRWQRKPRTYTDLNQMLDYTVETYRKALWGSQPSYVEVWIEKDTLAGVLYPVTAGFDVPLMVSRGYPSITYLWNAADAMAAANKPVHLYYLGDLDPSGVDIPRFIEQGIRERAPMMDFTLTRLAVLPEQVAEFALSTRPTKTSDSRAKGFDGASVELDAVPAPKLRELVEDAIVSHIDQAALNGLLVIEEAERETYRDFVARMRGDAA